MVVRFWAYTALISSEFVFVPFISGIPDYIYDTLFLCDSRFFEKASLLARGLIGGGSSTGRSSPDDGGAERAVHPLCWQ